MEKTICLVFDFGGGTLDISVLDIEGDKIKTLATDGDVHLGGTNFNNRMLERCVKFAQDKGHEINRETVRGKKALLRLYYACKAAKHSLLDAT